MWATGPSGTVASADDLAASEETLDVLSSAEAMRQLAESKAAVEAGDVLDADEIAAAVHEFITTVLLHNPHGVGKRLLLPSFEGTWPARRGTYRVLYEIDEDARVVTVTAIEHRADAYRSR